MGIVKRLVVLCLVSMLGACAGKGLGEAGYAAGLTDIPAGSELLLARPLDFAPGETQLIFQHGQIVTPRQLSVWEHHCVLKLDGPLAQELTIAPGSLPIAQVEREALAFFWGRSFTFITRLELAAAAYPDLTRLHCEIWNDNYLYAHIDRSALAEVMGDFAQLREAGAPAP